MHSRKPSLSNSCRESCDSHMIRKMESVLKSHVTVTQSEEMESCDSHMIRKMESVLKSHVTVTQSEEMESCDSHMIRENGVM